MFGVSAIMAAVISVAGILLIPPPPPSLRPEKVTGLPPIDWVGATLITIALIALTFALTEGNVVGWKTPWISVTIVVSLLLVGVFAAWQHRLEKRSAKGLGRPPLIKVSIFANKRFSAVMVIMALFFASFNNYLIFTTYFFQDFQGHSPLQTMLRFIPTGVGGALVALIVARLLSRVPTVFIILGGTASMAVACLLYAVPIPPTTSYFAYGLPAMLLVVIGADTTWPCMTLFTSQSLPREDQAMGGALINAVAQVGRSVGLALGTAIQTAVMASARGVSVSDGGGMKRWDGPSLKGLRAASWTNFALSMTALVLILAAFRSMEIVGKPADSPSKPSKSTNEHDAEQGVAVREPKGSEKETKS